MFRPKNLLVEPHCGPRTNCLRLSKDRPEPIFKSSLVQCCVAALLFFRNRIPQTQFNQGGAWQATPRLKYLLSSIGWQTPYLRTHTRHHATYANVRWKGVRRTPPSPCLHCLSRGHPFYASRPLYVCTRHPGACALMHARAHNSRCDSSRHLPQQAEQNVPPNKQCTKGGDQRTTARHSHKTNRAYLSSPAHLQHKRHTHIDHKGSRHRHMTQHDTTQQHTQPKR